MGKVIEIFFLRKSQGTQKFRGYPRNQKHSLFTDALRDRTMIGDELNYCNAVVAVVHSQ